MGAYLTLTRRELAAFFLSLSGYVTIAAAVLLMGQSFSAMLIQLQGESTSEPLTQTYPTLPQAGYLMRL